MAWLTVIFLSLLSRHSLGELSNIENCGKTFVPEGRIVNGTVTKPGKYPWMVSIHQRINTSFMHICGGAIINENWIVTAAHCFDNPIEIDDYQVYVGLYSILRKNRPTVQVFNLSQIVVHGDYDEYGYANDIALLKTDSPINISGSNGYVNAICLPSEPTELSGDATIIGWGKVNSTGPISAELREATVPIVPQEECEDIYESEDSEFYALEIVPSMLCAGGNGRDSCQFDSGGPLFQYDDEGTATLIGTIANGADCAYEHYPGIYMRMSSFTEWIEEVMEEDEEHEDGEL